MEKPQPAGTPGPAAPSTTYVQADATTFREVVQRLTGPIDGGASLRPPEASAAAPPRGALRSPSTARVAGVKRPPLAVQERRHGPTRPALVIPNRSGLHPSGEGWGSSPSPTSRGAPPPPPRSPLMSPSTNMASLSLGEREEPSSAATEAGGVAAVVGLLNVEEEERAIKEKRFYLHPSPRSSREKMLDPELLPLFPTTTCTSPAERS